MVQVRYEQLYQSSASAYPVQPASSKNPRFVGKLIASIILTLIPPFIGCVPLILTFVAYHQWKHGEYETYEKTR